MHLLGLLYFVTAKDSWFSYHQVCTLGYRSGATTASGIYLYSFLSIRLIAHAEILHQVLERYFGQYYQISVINVTLN